MAYYWVQQWVPIALPPIFEYQMSETSPDRRFPASAADEYNITIESTQGHGHTTGPSNAASLGTSPPFSSQYHSLSPGAVQPEHSRFQQSHNQSPYYAPTTHDQSQTMYNLSAMSSALPDYPPRRQQAGGPNQMNYQIPQTAQYQGQVPMTFSNQSTHSAGALPYGQYPQTFAQNQSPQAAFQQGYQNPQQRSTGHSPSYPNFMQNQQQYMYYPTQYGGHMNASAPQYGAVPSNMPSIPLRSASQEFLAGSQAQASLADQQQAPRRSSNAGIVPRGPPRKPKQSGHALWVGNLPPGTTVIDLKDHFSRDATRDIESLFLISKSNCAFVNYRTEESCTAAMHRFHDSRFHGVRLVCRLRRGSTLASGVPTGPSAMAENRIAPGPSKTLTDPADAATEVDRVDEAGDPKADDAAEEKTQPDVATLPTQDGVSSEAKRADAKFFIVKSLTLQDLELSVKNGIWATQSHNEASLNTAFETSDNVYLIFSANKSGEYFGYARMASRISEDAGDILNFSNQRTESVEAIDAPRAIPTAATEFAPKGRIIDDSARGTIFWEAEHSDEEELSRPKDEQTDPDPSPAADQSSGRPFKVEWISTNRLPFYRTRGLRNPWNANREVKIARDGTELETNVGKRLVQMFHRVAPGVPPQQHMIQSPPGRLF